MSGQKWFRFQRQIEKSEEWDLDSLHINTADNNKRK